MDKQVYIVNNPELFNQHGNRAYKLDTGVSTPPPHYTAEVLKCEWSTDVSPMRRSKEKQAIKIEVSDGIENECMLYHVCEGVNGSRISRVREMGTSEKDKSLE